MAELPQPINHTVEAIYRAYETEARYERTYLGMSTLGAECDRALWYSFRWVHTPEEFDGRKLRLFQTGHREEARLIEDLRIIGVDVQETDPSTGRQWEVVDATGHVRGHLDGVAIGVPEAPKAEHVVECKTHNDRSFKELAKRGVEHAKPTHYAQMQLYMHHKGIHRALYIAENKNDDSLYTERVKYDAAFSIRLMARAERIVASDRAPGRLHEDPASKAAFACQWCPALAQCHEGAFARVNCRTCLSAEFLAGAVVRCALRNEERSYADQQRGCPQHLYLPDLVPGEQVDAGSRWVSYRMRDGRDWRDGAKEEGRAA